MRPRSPLFSSVNPSFPLSSFTLPLVGLVALAACAATTEDEHGAAEASVSEGRTLRVGLASEPTAMDPHHFFLDPNINVGKPVFESLYEYGPDKEIVPLLATAGAPTGDGKVWSFSLKKGVRFHRGQAFTKADVLCSFERVLSSKDLATSGGYSAQLSAIDMAATAARNAANTDPYTLEIATKAPYPFLTSNLANILVMSCDDARAAQALESSEPAAERSAKILRAFADGTLANGTGPYLYRAWTTRAADPTNPRIDYDRNPAYHRASPAAWSAIQTVFVPDPGERIARLRSGDLDFVEAVPGPRVAEVEQAGFATFKARGLRVMHMYMYQASDGREASPAYVPVKDEAGKAYPNPFVSRAFRRACALATDKQALVDVMGGLAVPTGQMLPPGRTGHLVDRPDDTRDVDAARRAFAEASKEPTLGYLAGTKLTLTIHGPNDRYPNDAATLEAVAKAWTDAFGDFTVDGVSYSLAVKAAPEPKATYFANAKKYGIGLVGGGIDNGHVSGALRLYLLPESGLNFGNYQNATVKAAYDRGASDANLAASDATLEGALRLALDDDALLPLFNPLVVWAGKKDLAFAPRADDLTLPDRITPARGR